MVASRAARGGQRAWRRRAPGRGDVAARRPPRTLAALTGNSPMPSNAMHGCGCGSAFMGDGEPTLSSAGGSLQPKAEPSHEIPHAHPEGSHNAAYTHTQRYT